VGVVLLVLLASDPTLPLRPVFALLAVAAASLYAWWFRPRRK
jgi:hypothetical protein